MEKNSSYIKMYFMKVTERTLPLEWFNVGNKNYASKDRYRPNWYFSVKRNNSTLYILSHITNKIFRGKTQVIFNTLETYPE